MKATISLESIRQARERIGKYIARTPCELSVGLSEMTGARVFVKLDNQQATGSFKERGAANKLLQLTEAEKKRGVVTPSAGNHGLGVAYQAKKLGIPATIVMPKGAPLIKQSNVKRLGATVVLHGESYADALSKAREIEEEKGQVFVHGFDDVAVIEGQGTMGLEIIESVPDVDAVIVPVGGGGLIAGVGTAVKGLRPQVKVIGVEPERYASMVAALAAHEPVTIEASPTIADGLAVNRVGGNALDIAARAIDQMVTVTEDEIAKAILVLLEVEKTVVEGAGAAPLAAMFTNKIDLKGKTVVLTLCGGNIDVNMMANIIERGLVKDGRLAWLRTFVSDKPGQLAAIGRVIADAGASVKDVRHNRAFGRVEPGGVEIDWILETRGHDHIAELVTKLREKKIRVLTLEDA
ncbi:MAG TPA: threonine ammonia-lyase [Verrucomicrobiae bacterium]|nr:threonine ammonia-lyase [Verrucomicrobiae bacterium]